MVYMSMFAFKGEQFAAQHSKETPPTQDGREVLFTTSGKDIADAFCELVEVALRDDRVKMYSIETKPLLYPGERKPSRRRPAVVGRLGKKKTTTVQLTTPP